MSEKYYKIIDQVDGICRNNKDIVFSFSIVAIKQKYGHLWLIIIVLMVVEMMYLNLA